MIKKIFIPFVIAIVVIACQDGFTDPISSVDPGTDASAPTITINYPKNDVVIPFTENETDIEFDILAEDDIELGSVTISLDGTQIASFDSFLDFRRANETYLEESVDVGDHTLVVAATDLSGKSASVSFDFEVTNQYVAKANEVFFMPFEGGINLELISEVEATSVGTGFASGVSGQAADFDAANTSYLLFPGDVMSGLSNFTVSFWTRAQFVDGDDNGAIDGMQGVFGLSNTTRFWANFHMFVENGSNPSVGGDMRIHTQNGFNDPTYSEAWINPDNVSNMFGSWVNHVVTYDDATREFKYYVDGALINTTVAGWTDALTFVSSGQIVMGCAQFMTDPSLTATHGAEPWAGYFTGQIDEVRIFNKALSQSEVTSLYSEVAGE